MHYIVTSTLGGEDAYCGDLYTSAHRGRESVMFQYSQEWQSAGYPLSPDLPLQSAPFSSAQGFCELRAFEDCMPDRWGRNLLRRDERLKAADEARTPRMLLESDYLVGVSDLTRQGAIRIWSEDGRALEDGRRGVPREVDLPDLLRAADLAAEDLDADIRDLIDAGSSLGGARPKASIKDKDGNLYICKLPKTDETGAGDVCAWEHVAMTLAGRFGIRTPESRLVRIGQRSALLVRRFDREGERRIPYISGMTAVSGNDGGTYSLLDLAQFIESYGAHAESDLVALWHRALFTCAVGNTDNHMRNYGFLMDDHGWTLAPQFDVNPTPALTGAQLACGVDDADFSADPELAIEAAGLYRVDEAQVLMACNSLARVLSGWRVAAARGGLSGTVAEAMAPRFDGAVRRLDEIVGKRMTPEVEAEMHRRRRSSLHP